MTIKKSLLRPYTIARQIDMPVVDWPGSCYQVASRLVNTDLVPDGCRVVSGEWTGEFIYGKYREQILAWSEDIGTGRHSWVEAPDGMVIDPTRYVFEGVQPYVYVGVKDHYVN